MSSHRHDSDRVFPHEEETNCQCMRKIKRNLNVRSLCSSTRRRRRGRGRGLIKRRRRPLLLPPHYAIMIRNQSALYSAPSAILEESSVIASARDYEFIVGLCKIVDAPRASVKFPFPSSLPKISRGLNSLFERLGVPTGFKIRRKPGLFWRVMHPSISAPLHQVP